MVLSAVDDEAAMVTMGELVAAAAPSGAVRCGARLAVCAAPTLSSITMLEWGSTWK